MLQSLGIKPDGLVGHSVGEISCGYGDGCLTSKEALLCAYWRGVCLQRHNLAPGAMAAVGELILLEIIIHAFIHTLT